ncbi:uncharacterized protein LOC119272035 [Triticum dicoccoides]|uniref:uncharacterized protein LOC119272035 n=1 Tax=Triticum dicoccoides TaxID=85692 RepID=UPI00188DF71E|nr:uncharacterized protein LOC119272035 [Triticum dicoccoides]
MATSNELSMKLLIEGKSQKVCFAEAGSEFVEFLTGLLSLPLGTVTTLLTKERMSGSIGNVLGSMEKLDANYKSSELPLSPAVAPAALSRLQQLLGVQLGNANNNNTNGRTMDPTIWAIPPSTFLADSGTDVCSKFFSAASGSVCPGCSRRMDKCGGHILVEAKGSAATTTPLQPTYTVGDDLSVAPASNMVSGITLLARCGVKDLSTLQERTVKIGKEEALGILAASLTSKTVLTDVFLPKKNARCKREAPEEVIHI